MARPVAISPPCNGRHPLTRFAVAAFSSEAMCRGRHGHHGPTQGIIDPPSAKPLVGVQMNLTARLVVVASVLAVTGCATRAPVSSPQS